MPPATTAPVCVLLVAAGADWESRALAELDGRGGVVVLKRCVDVDDLLATSAAGQAHVAVVALDAPGLDAAAVEHLRRQHVRPVAVATGTVAAVDQGRHRAHRIGINVVLGEADLAGLADVVTDASPDEPPRPLEETPIDEAAVPARDPGRVLVVWGPQGAPGRSTLAAGLGSALAAAGHETVLVDADPYGGALAQQLGVLDEVSGLLSAARLSTAGHLLDRLATVPRSVAPRLSLVTGLPRPDRWIEVRAGAVEHLLEALRAHAHVVVDTGFSLEDDAASDFGGRPPRNAMTLGALLAADEVLLVATPDPVGLSRLARGLVDLREVVPATPVRVVVNRLRPGLGWSEREVRDLVSGLVTGLATGVGRVEDVHVLPDDRPATDRALLKGRTLVECGDSPLLRAVVGLADQLAEPPGAGRRARRVGRPSRVRRRRGGRARPR